MSNQRPPARSWLLRLASQSRNIDPPPPPPPQPAPAAPPPRGPLLRQGSLALGRTPPILPPPSTPPPATLPTTLSPVLLPPRLPSPPPAAMPPIPPPASAPPPPQPFVTVPAPKPATANGNRPATTSTTARPIIATPTPPPSPIAVTLTRSPIPSRSPKVVANPTAASENASASINGTKVILSNDAGKPVKNRSDSFDKRNGDAKAPSSALLKREDNKTPATGNGSGSNKKDAERGTRAVTLAGRNIGAFMDLGAAYSHQIMKQQQQSFYAKSQPESEEKRDAMSVTHHTAAESGGGGRKPFFSLVNSNVQSVNNSLLLGASCIQGSPGVHINLGRNHRRKNGADASTQKSPPPLQ